jgi:hypothetical protein
MENEPLMWKTHGKHDKTCFFLMFLGDYRWKKAAGSPELFDILRIELKNKLFSHGFLFFR